MAINILKNILFYLVSFIFVVFALVCFVFYYYGRSLPSELTLLEYSPPATTRIYSSDNKLVEEYAVERRVIVNFERIPLLIKGAFMIAEDKNFYTHSGISAQSLIRAIIENTSKKAWKTKPAGGSTITQQVAKNLLVGNQRSISRKIKEAIMAFRIESSISKDKILEIYLNHIYLGKGCYGIVEACNYYFGKNIEDVKPEEAAFLASLTSAPSIYTNNQDNSKILTKRNAVLSQMYDLGFITREQLIKSLSADISIETRKTKLSVPYFSEEIHRLFVQNIGTERDFFTGGYSVYTTMDSRIQAIAQKSLEDGLMGYDKKYGQWRGAVGHNNLDEVEKKLPRTVNKIKPVIVIEKTQDIYKCQDSKKNIINIKNTCKLETGDVVLSRDGELCQMPEVTGAIIVMDAMSGDVLAMSGGYSFDMNAYNCATQAKRQPGSTIKPFVYAAALESGMSEYDEIEDKPVVIRMGDGSYYSPHNYSNRTYGKIIMRDGLIYSRNLATVDMVLRAGIPIVSKFLRKFGLVDGKFHISYILGSHEVTLLDIVSSFSAFVNGGNVMYPRFVKYMTRQRDPGKELKNQLTISKSSKNVVSKETADTIKNMLLDAAKYGTASRLSKIAEEHNNISVGGKTGTTNDFKDAWFVGYVTNDSRTLIVGVFVGHLQPKSLGDHASGARIALPIFARFLEDYCKN